MCVQIPPPFGAHRGGVNPAFFAIPPSPEFDSWLTVGITDGDAGERDSDVAEFIIAHGECAPRAIRCVRPT